MRHPGAPAFVKLDTQGTELSVWPAPNHCFGAGRIVGIELESTLQAQPVMQGAASFGRPASTSKTLGSSCAAYQADLWPVPFLARPRCAATPSRTNATPFLRCGRMWQRRWPSRFGLPCLVFISAMGFLKSSLSSLEDAHTCAFLDKSGCDCARLTKTLRSMAR